MIHRCSESLQKLVRKLSKRYGSTLKRINFRFCFHSFYLCAIWNFSHKLSIFLSLMIFVGPNWPWHYKQRSLFGTNFWMQKNAIHGNTSETSSAAPATGTIGLCFIITCFELYDDCLKLVVIRSFLDSHSRDSAAREHYRQKHCLLRYWLVLYFKKFTSKMS